MERQTYEFDIETKTPLGLPVEHGLKFYSCSAASPEAAQAEADAECARLANGDILVATMRPTKPLVDGGGLPIVFIEFSMTKSGYRPRYVVCQGDGKRAEYEFDWCEKPQVLCFNKVCSGAPGERVDVCGYAEPEKMPGLIWHAAGIKIESDDGPVDAQGLEALGMRLSDAVPANPFEDAWEDETEWCGVCGSHFPEERGCDHVQWNEELGFRAGCGSDELDIAEVQASLFSLLEVLPPRFVDGAIDQMMNHGGLNFRYSYGDLTCDVFWRTTINERKLFAEHEGVRRYTPAIYWLTSLDKESPLPNALTLGWLWQFKQATGRSHAWDGGLPLIWRLENEEMEKWMAIDPLVPGDLDMLEVRRKFKPQSANDSRFQQNPMGTREVIFWPKTGSIRELDLRLSVAQVYLTQDGCVRIVFGRVIEKSGKHISTLPGYDLCEFK